MPSEGKAGQPISLIWPGAWGCAFGLGLGLAVAMLLTYVDSQSYLDRKARTDYSNELETVVIGFVGTFGLIGSLLGLIVGDRHRQKRGGVKPGDEVGPFPDWAVLLVLVLLVGTISFLASLAVPAVFFGLAR